MAPISMRVRAQPHQVAVEPRQLRQHHPHPLRLRRNLQPQQLFHRQAVAQVVRERRQVIHAVGQRHALLVRLDFEFLLDAGVQISRCPAAHLTTVSPSSSSSSRSTPCVDGCCGPMFRTMRRGRLRLLPRLPVTPGTARCRSCLNPRPRDRIILAQRVSFPIVRHHDAAQVGMPENWMPNRSNTSRSYQLAPRHTPVTDSITGSSPRTRHFSRTAALRSTECR